MAEDFVPERTVRYYGKRKDEEGYNKGSWTEARSWKSKTHISVTTKHKSLGKTTQCVRRGKLADEWDKVKRGANFICAENGV